MVSSDLFSTPSSSSEIDRHGEDPTLSCFQHGCMIMTCGRTCMYVDAFATCCLPSKNYALLPGEFSRCSNRACQLSFPVADARRQAGKGATATYCSPPPLALRSHGCCGIPKSWRIIPRTELYSCGHHLWYTYPRQPLARIIEDLHVS